MATNRRRRKNIRIPGLDRDWDAVLVLCEKEAVLTTCTSADRKCLLSRPVSLQDLSDAFEKLPHRPALLPRNTIYYKPTGNAAEMGIFIPASIRPLQVRGRTYQVPLPNLVFLGKGNGYRVFAIKDEWPTGGTRLYQMPAPNVFDGGGICAGELQFPVCDVDTIHKAFEIFINSYFNNHLDTGRVLTDSKSALTLWGVLDETGAEEFPLDLLKPLHKRLKDFMGVDDASDI